MKDDRAKILRIHMERKVMANQTDTVVIDTEEKEAVVTDSIPKRQQRQKEEYEQLEHNGLKEELERTWKEGPVLEGTLGIFNQAYCKCTVSHKLCGLGKELHGLK